MHEAYPTEYISLFYISLGAVDAFLDLKLNFFAVDRNYALTLFIYMSNTYENLPTCLKIEGILQALTE